MRPGGIPRGQEAFEEAFREARRPFMRPGCIPSGIPWRQEAFLEALHQARRLREVFHEASRHSNRPGGILRGREAFAGGIP